jgi:hypothetical protein
MLPDLTLAKLSLLESADYLVGQAGFFANLDSSDSQPSLSGLFPLLPPGMVCPFRTALLLKGKRSASKD